MRPNREPEATIVEKYAAVETFLDERGHRIWATTESRAIGYGGDALVSDATGTISCTGDEVGNLNSIKVQGG